MSIPHHMSSAASFAALLFFVAIAAAWAVLADESRLRTESLWIETKSGAVHMLLVEVAETSEQQTLGLMFRTHLGDKNGMLFPYKAPREITMWMKNTYIPLDMVFIRTDGRVHRIAVRTEPLSEAQIGSRGQVTAVLELPGGAAERMGITPGDLVRHTHFASGPRK